MQCLRHHSRTAESGTGWGPAVWVLTSPASDSDVYSCLRTNDLEKLLMQ